MIALINASPKIHESASKALINDFKPFISAKEVWEVDIKKHSSSTEIMEKLMNCEAIVFVFPLYVDGIPSHLLSNLVELEDYARTHKTNKPIVYGICNCGFYEGEQTRLALRNLEIWCKKSGLRWGQGLGIGAGGMIVPISNVPVGKGPKKDFLKTFEEQGRYILEGKSGENIYVTTSLPRFAYKFAAEHNWKSLAKTNGLKKKDLFKKATV